MLIRLLSGTKVLVFGDASGVIMSFNI